MLDVGMLLPTITSDYDSDAVPVSLGDMTSSIFVRGLHTSRIDGLEVFNLDFRHERDFELGERGSPDPKAVDVKLVVRSSYWTVSGIVHDPVHDGKDSMRNVDCGAFSDPS